jgi:hypothetical protein
MAQQTWHQLQDFPRWQRVGALVVAPIELVLTVTAAVDLARRPSSQVRGPKTLWWLTILVQPVGPIAYLKWARRR